MDEQAIHEQEWVYMSVILIFIDMLKPRVEINFRCIWFQRFEHPGFVKILNQPVTCSTETQFQLKRIQWHLPQCQICITSVLFE